MGAKKHVFLTSKSYNIYKRRLTFLSIFGDEPNLLIFKI